MEKTDHNLALERSQSLKETDCIVNGKRIPFEKLKEL